MHSRNQFEEQFEDSEANFSEAGAGLASDRGQGRPIQLLKVHPSGRIELCEQALSLIASCESQVAFASIVGKMRTGKSCLLNRMLGLSGRGFRVDPSVSSCTQGIWIWSQPIFNEVANCLVFFMDTEGSESLQKDSENDAKIFTLSLLISSYLVYNSVGCIDQRSISDLQMVTALAHKVRTDDRLSESESKEQLFRYMPKFIWLLRDVTLKIEDQYGKKITPSQYLQNCLTDQNSSQASRSIKKSLLTYFKDRECITMVRPVGDETQLQRLDSIPDHALRRQFVEVVGKLRDKLIKGSRPKNFGGQDVTGPAMADLIEVFVESFNSGTIPSIKSAWAQIAEDEGAKAYNLAINRYQEVFLQEFSDDEPKSDDELRQALFRLRQATTKQFQENGGAKRQHQDFRIKLRNLIDDKEAYIIDVNRNVCETHNHQILVNLSQEMKVKMASNSYKGNKKQLQSDFDGIIERYNQQAKGATKAQILAQFVRTMNTAIFSMESDSPQKEDNTAQKIRIEELQRLNKIREKEMESLRKQLQAKQNQVPVGNKKDNKRQPPPQKSSQGCCSGDKCLIM